MHNSSFPLISIGVEKSYSAILLAYALILIKDPVISFIIIIDNTIANIIPNKATIDKVIIIFLNTLSFSLLAILAASIFISIIKLSLFSTIFLIGLTLDINIVLAFCKSSF